MPVPTIAELVIYPVKSCAGLSVRSAVATRHGLAVDGVYDREWMVVTPQGQFLTQREHPRMALVTPRLKADTLELRAPGMMRLELALGLPDCAGAATLDVEIWDDRVAALDCGDVAAAWFSAALGTPCRLVRFHPEVERLASTEWTGGLAAPTQFQDGYPILVCGTASLDDLNDRLRAQGRAALPMNRFRPNVAIAGLPPFEEDYCATLTAGEVVLQPVKPCPRCPIPSVDQASGVPGPDPLDILCTYRARPELDGAICFGMNAIVLAGDGLTVSVGQEVVEELNF